MKEHQDLIMPAVLPSSYESDTDTTTIAFHGDVEEAFLNDFYKHSLRLVKKQLYKNYSNEG